MAKKTLRNSDHLTSGLELQRTVPLLTSGSPHSVSGSTRMTSGQECWGAFAVGQGVGQATTIPFLLAPRLYVLSQAGSGPKAVAKSNGAQEALGDLPQHLMFQESSPAVAQQMQQTWKSEYGTWELLVQRQGDTIRATLSASPSTDVAQAGRMIWENTEGWDAFGINRLEPACGKLDAPPLLVAAR